MSKWNEDEFNKRYLSNEYDNIRLGGINCPEAGSYDLYAASFLQTISEMKRLGYRIPKSYKMPKEAIQRADEVICKMAKTWKIIYEIQKPMVGSMGFSYF